MRPICKCGKPAITVIYGNWICGECLVKFEEKKKELTKKILEEIQNEGIQDNSADK